MKHSNIPPRPARAGAKGARSPARISKPRRAPPDDSRTLGSLPAFVPASPRERHDGWTPDKQIAFIETLAECACVTEACERVGQSPSSAYRLRRRVDAYSFRAAWDAALDHAIHRLSDAALSRALNGVTRPVFFQGEQVGERRYFDERLTMFLLRYRDPDSYGKWRDRREPRRRPDARAILLDRWIGYVAEDAWDRDDGAAIDREREDDAAQWLTNEEVELAERTAAKRARATEQETDTWILAGIAAIQRLKAMGVDPAALKEGEFARQVEAEQQRRAAAGAPDAPPDAPDGLPEIDDVGAAEEGKSGGT